MLCGAGVGRKMGAVYSNCQVSSQILNHVTHPRPLLPRINRLCDEDLRDLGAGCNLQADLW